MRLWCASLGRLGMRASHLDEAVGGKLEMSVSVEIEFDLNI
jgi:hypothetical protein